MVRQAAQLTEFEKGVFEHPRANLDNQAARFGGFDHARCIQKTSCGGSETHQGLERGQAFIRGVHDRLIVQRKFGLVSRAGQQRGKPQPLKRGFLHEWMKDRVICQPFLPDVIQGNRGISDSFLSAACFVIRSCKPETKPQGNLVVVESDRFLKRFFDPGDDILNLVLLAPFQENEKLVLFLPRNRQGIGECLGKPVPCPLQDRTSLFIANAVDNNPEPLNIGVNHQERTAIRSMALESLNESGKGRQPGHPVDVSQVADMFEQAGFFVSQCDIGNKKLNNFGSDTLIQRSQWQPDIKCACHSVSGHQWQRDALSSRMRGLVFNTLQYRFSDQIFTDNFKRQVDLVLEITRCSKNAHHGDVGAAIFRQRFKPAQQSVYWLTDKVRKMIKNGRSKFA